MSGAPRIRIERNPKWIRGFVGGTAVVDSRAVRNVWETPYYPAWYVPLADVHCELRANGNIVRSPRRGDGTRYDLVVGGRTVTDAAWHHIDSPVEELRGLVRFEWTAMDAWFEEDVEVFVHPRSPEVRVDTLRSSRHVRVFVGGDLVADSTRPTILFETGLPARFYLPKTDVRMDLLRPTDSTSACPYKGFAQYWDVVIGEQVHHDLVWSYRTPLPESTEIAGLMCFYNEHVDLEIDGERAERPRTKFT